MIPQADISNKLIGTVEKWLHEVDLLEIAHEKALQTANVQQEILETYEARILLEEYSKGTFNGGNEHTRKLQERLFLSEHAIYQARTQALQDAQQDLRRVQLELRVAERLYSLAKLALRAWIAERSTQ